MVQAKDATMKTTKYAVLTLLAASLAGISAKANTVTLNLTPGYDWWGGGEFTANNTTQDFITGNYSSKAVLNGGFETFCIETGVEFYPGRTYNYTLGSVAQPIPATGAGSAIPLSLGAAYLYYEFAKGSLSDFDYVDTLPNGTRANDDHLLQAAIWAFQGGQSYGSYPVPTQENNKFYTDAISALGGLTQADGANNGFYDVEILQMWNGTPGVGANAAQNQLVLAKNDGPVPHPVPDGGMTVTLLAGALVGLVAMGRKLFC